MARLPFVDTHVHFHDMRHPSLRYEWLEPDAPIDPLVGPDGAIRALSYLPDDFIAESRFHNVSEVVHVQAAIGTPDPVEETRWLQAHADRLGLPQAIIGCVDLGKPEAAGQIERHRAFANFRGVRDLRYDDYLSNDAWREGYALLDGLVCCDDPFIEQAALVRELALTNPGVTLCIDHACFPGFAGMPRSADRADFRTWREAIRKLAAAPSVVMKISGLGVSDHCWTVESIRPWVVECIEAFGTERCFFGTDWPLGRLYSSYGDLVDAYAEIVADLPESDQAALFHGNARRVFGLEQEAR